jgi:hypothetical protein
MHWINNEWMLTLLGWIERYLELLKDRKIKGYLFEEKNYFSKSS